MLRDLLAHGSFHAAIVELASRDIRLIPDVGAFKSGGIAYGARLADGDFMRLTIDGTVATLSIFDRTNTVYVCDLDHDGSGLVGTVGGFDVRSSLIVEGVDVAELLGRMREVALAAGRSASSPLSFRHAAEPTLEAA